MENKIKQLRQEYLEKPWKREIIIRQIRALEIASGKKLIKTLDKRKQLAI